ncbi:MAG: hypothetical protein HC899_39115 [Leptolyngbyaceae cyanobacterium SM1_4_3]|nr:hypothetical protein [Leptolyngbyaceae cyanobacterium SM1_4_3]
MLYKIQHEKRFQPITVQLAPTENCDSNCDFCSVSWRDVTKKLSWPVIEKGLREFKELGAKALELSVRGDEIIPLQTEEGFYFAEDY